MQWILETSYPGTNNFIDLVAGLACDKYDYNRLTTSSATDKGMQQRNK